MDEIRQISDGILGKCQGGTPGTFSDKYQGTFGQYLWESGHSQGMHSKVSKERTRDGSLFCYLGGFLMQRRKAYSSSLYSSRMTRFKVLPATLRGNSS